MDINSTIIRFFSFVAILGVPLLADFTSKLHDFPHETGETSLSQQSP